MVAGKSVLAARMRGGLQHTITGATLASEAAAALKKTNLTPHERKQLEVAYRRLVEGLGAEIDEMRRLSEQLLDSIVM